MNESNGKLEAVIEQIVEQNNSCDSEMDWTDHAETHHSDDGYCAFWNG